MNIFKVFSGVVLAGLVVVGGFWGCKKDLPKPPLSPDSIRSLKRDSIGRFLRSYSYEQNQEKSDWTLTTTGYYTKRAYPGSFYTDRRGKRTESKGVRLFSVEVKESIARTACRRSMLSPPAPVWLGELLNCDSWGEEESEVKLGAEYRAGGTLLLQGFYGEEQVEKDVDLVDKQSIQASVRELVSQNYVSIKPSLSLSITPIYSPANLRCKLLENDCWTVAEFQQIRDAWVAENSHALVRIDESYFNMEFVPRGGDFMDFFTDRVTLPVVESAMHKGPVGFVNSLVFGRSYYLLYSSKAPLPELMWWLQRIFRIEYGNLLIYTEHTDFDSQVYVIRRGAPDHMGFTAGTPVPHAMLVPNFPLARPTVEELLEQPISYTIKRLYDGKIMPYGYWLRDENRRSNGGELVRIENLVNREKHWWAAIEVNGVEVEAEPAGGYYFREGSEIRLSSLVYSEQLNDTAVPTKRSLLRYPMRASLIVPQAFPIYEELVHNIGKIEFDMKASLQLNCDIVMKVARGKGEQFEEKLSVPVNVKFGKSLTMGWLDITEENEGSNHVPGQHFTQYAKTPYGTVAITINYSILKSGLRNYQLGRWEEVL